MYKFIHAADVHLDSPLKGLSKYEGAPVDNIRQASRRALENLVKLAIKEEVKFVLIAGDLYDGDWNGYGTGLFFISQMVKLREAGINVYLIAGNHDAANRMTKSLNLDALGNVKMLSHKKPETIDLPDLATSIHGQSFGEPATLSNLSVQYPNSRSGNFNIGMLHTSATGREGHERYAPCTLDDLRGKNYSYWALGHVHNREILCPEHNIVFPGNIQGRHIRETGPKGCMLVTVDDNLTCSHEFKELDVQRWNVRQVDVSNLSHSDDLHGSVQAALSELMREDDMPYAVRVELTGATSLHSTLAANTRRWDNEIRSIGIQVDAERIWIEKIRFLTTEPSNSKNNEFAADGPLGELQALFEESIQSADSLQVLGIHLQPFVDKLPNELRKEFLLSDSALFQDLMRAAQAKLEQQLSGEVSR